MARLLGIGDNTVDVYVDRGMQYPGGNAVNVAVQARRLGLEASYLGCLGDDARGDLIGRSLIQERVDISRMRRLSGPNAFSRVAHRGQDRQFIGSDPGVRGRYGLGPDDDAFIAAHDLAHTSVHSDIEDELPRIRAHAPLLSYDYSEHLARPGKEATLRFVDIAFLSCPGAAEADCRALAQHVAARGPSLVVVTRGALGACALAGGAHHTCGVHPADIVDTLGAGDAFIAGFLAAHLERWPIPACLDRAAANAALACGGRGAYGHGEPAAPIPQPPAAGAHP